MLLTFLKATMFTCLIVSNIAMAESSESKGKHIFHKAGSTEVYRRGAMLSEFLLTAEQTEGRYSIVSEVFKRGMSSYPGHTHHWHSEVFYIIEGTMEWTVNGETQEIGPGDLIYVPPNSPHAGKVVGSQDVRALMLYEPGGYEINYLRRRALSETELKDPDVMKKLMKQADVNLVE